LYHRVTVWYWHGTAWYWHINRHVGQQKNIEDPEIIPQYYSHLIFNKDAESIHGRKDSLFNK
jgi:hypothetical protein